jgi:hypothetical protein
VVLLDRRPEAVGATRRVVASAMNRPVRSCRGLIHIEGDVTAATRDAAAHHEAGHAVVAMALGWDVHQSRLGQLRENDWWGDTDVHGGFPAPIDSIKVLLGGGAGEALYRGSPQAWPVGCGCEWEEALARADTSCKGDADDVVAEAWAATKELVASHQVTWRRFAAGLSAAGALGTDDCRRLLGIPDSAWIDPEVGTS